ncbi:MAG: hypothetical protein Q4D16_06300 [Eubacteriales bacterium]|nr:hypothetical protein [Eubacteriales bacterium]
MKEVLFTGNILRGVFMHICMKIPRHTSCRIMEYGQFLYVLEYTAVLQQIAVSLYFVVLQSRELRNLQFCCISNVSSAISAEEIDNTYKTPNLINFIGIFESNEVISTGLKWKIPIKSIEPIIL